MVKWINVFQDEKEREGIFYGEQGKKRIWRERQEQGKPLGRYRQENMAQAGDGGGFGSFAFGTAAFGVWERRWNGPYGCGTG